MTQVVSGTGALQLDDVGPEKNSEMDIWVEVRDHATAESVRVDLERRLREVLSVRVGVRPVAIGELDVHTGTARNSKIRRLLDRRKQG